MKIFGTFNSSTAWRMNKILAQIKHLNKKRQHQNYSY
jgi:hypothetical protein